MKSYILVVLILFSLISYDQETTILNQATYGGDGVDFGITSVLNTDGTILIAGTSGSGISGEKTLASYGSSDVWVMLLNADYSIGWQAVYGGSGNDESPKVIKTTDGGYLIGCYSNSPISGNKTVASFGLADYWIIKINASGIIEWQNVYGGTAGETFAALAENSNGDFILAGTSASSISGNKTENSQGFSDYWVVKIDQDGNIIWDKTIGGSNIDNLVDMVLDSDDNILLSGYSFSDISGNKTEMSYGDEDYWLVKVDQTGSIIWDRTYGGSTLDSQCRVSVTNSAYYLAGYSASGISGVKSEGTIGGIDVWILKIDFDGDIIWDKTIGGSANDSPSSSPLISDDYQVLLGCSSMSDISGHKSENSYNGSQDFWLVSIDTNGIFLWDKTIGGNQLEALYSVHEKSDNNYILFGYSDSNISGDKDENSRGAEDYWIVEVSSTVGISENVGETILIYPNPASTYIQFSSAISNLKISTIQGQLILFRAYVESETISVADFPAGIYIVGFEFEGKIYSKRIVIE